MDIKPIKKDDADYERALRHVEQLWTATKGSPEGDELEVLVTLIEAYEDQHYPMDCPIPLKQSNSDWNKRERICDLLLV